MNEQQFTGERYIPADCTDAEIRIEHTQRYIFAIEWVNGKIVLDAACGEGYGSNILSGYAKTVIGLDLDDNTIKNAEEKYASDNLSFIQGSIENLPFENNMFDVVVSFETVEHVDDEIQKKFLTEIKRVLKPDGLLIMSTPNKKIYTDLVSGENLFHKKEFYYQEYKDYIKREFLYSLFYEQYPELLYMLTNKDNNYLDLSKKETEEARYYLSVSSNVPVARKEYVDFVSNSNMYYFLNKYSHKKEKELLVDAQKRNEFENMLNSGLEEAKKYNEHLERDIRELKEEIRKKDEYIRVLEEKAKKINWIN